MRYITYLQLEVTLRLTTADVINADADSFRKATFVEGDYCIVEESSKDFQDIHGVYIFNKNTHKLIIIHE